MSSFGSVLKEIRRQLGLSQAQLAARLGSTQRHVSFLETGRSAATRSFLSRICQELNLSVAQRANLFDASGMQGPYLRRPTDSPEITGALEMMQRQILNIWPYPALILDADWRILRRNAAFERMLGPFLPDCETPVYLMEILLSDAFRAMIANWPEVVQVIYFRLQAQAARNKSISELLTRLRSEGLFDGLKEILTGQGPVPVYIPIVLNMPDGTQLQMTSMLGKLASIQDAVLSDIEIELMVPVDSQSEQSLRKLLEDG